MKSYKQFIGESTAKILGIFNESDFVLLIKRTPNFSKFLVELANLYNMSFDKTQEEKIRQEYEKIIK